MELNQFTFSGRLGKDAEMRYLQDGTAVSSFNVALGTKGKGGAEKTLWFKVTIWRKLAETLTPMLLKGSRVIITGELGEDEYTDKTTNATVKQSVVNATTVVLISSKPEGAASGGAPQRQDDIPF